MPGNFVFVSHVNEDREAATAMVAALEAAGLVCWIAPRDVQPGRPYDDEIEAAIEGCAAMLLVFSDRCNDSEYIRREVTVAGEARKRIIPVRIEDAQPKRGLRMRLVDLHWIDAFPAREDAIAELLRTLKAGATPQRAAPIEETSARPASASAAPSSAPTDERSPPPQPHHTAPQPQHEDMFAKREIDGLIGVIRARIIALSIATIPVGAIIAHVLGMYLGVSIAVFLVTSVIAAVATPLIAQLVARVPYLSLAADVRKHAGSEYFRERLGDLNRSGFLRAAMTVEAAKDSGITYRPRLGLFVGLFVLLLVLSLVGLR